MSHVLYLILAFSFFDLLASQQQAILYKAVQIFKGCYLRATKSPDVSNSFTTVSSWQ